MKKKIILGIVTLGFVFGLSSCGAEETTTSTTISTVTPSGNTTQDKEEHTHTYSTEWTKTETEHYHASTCGHSEVKDKATHTWNAGEVTTEATCIAEGVKTYKCTVCEYTKTETIAKVEHTWDDGIITTPATCSSAGVKTYTCTVDGCGETKTEPIPTTAHSFTNYVSDNNATCTADGTKTSTCDNCTKTDTIADEGSKKAHTLTHHDLVQATCTSTGTKEYYECSECNGYFLDAEGKNPVEYTGSFDSWKTIPVGQHSFTNYLYNNDATCVTDGTETATCDNCTATDTRTKVGTATGIHSFTNYTYNDNATCVADGTETAKCDHCTETDTRTKAGTATGVHTFTNYVYDNNATCTADGTETAKCEKCTETDTRTKAGTMVSHSFTNYVSDLNSTCTEDGTKTAKCDNCTKTDTIADVGSATGHSFTNYISDGNATCVADGTKTATCDNGCGKTDTITDVNSKNSVPHIWNSGVITTPATCTSKGVKTYTCTVDGCGAQKTEDVQKTQHNWNSLYTTDKEPTCTEAGSKSIHCLDCDATKNSTEIAANDHTWDTGNTTKAATCTEAGNKLYTCSVCKETKNEPIPAKCHAFSTTFVTDEEATCTTAGSKSKHCTNAGCSEVSEVTVIKATGHAWKAGKVITAATCSAEGSQQYTCLNGCGETKTEPISKLQHSFNTYYTTDVPATCTTAGSKSHHCANCSETDTPETIDALGHDWSAWIHYPKATCNAEGVETRVCERSGCEEQETRPVAKLPLELKSTAGITFVDKVASLEVDNSVTTYDLSGLTVPSGAKIIISSTASGSDSLGYTPALSMGNNTIYIIIRDLDEKETPVVYTLKIKRMVTYNVYIDYVLYDVIEEGTELQENFYSTAKAGYTFNGWYVDSKLISFPYTINKETSFILDYTANDDTEYIVKHIQANVNGTYPTTATEIDYKTGTTDTDTAATAKEYTGFEAETITQANINGDGSTVVVIKYKRIESDLTCLVDDKYGDEAGSVKPSIATLKYGASKYLEATANDNYVFVGWYDTSYNLISKENPYLFTMGLEDVTIIAKFNSTITHVVLNLDGGSFDWDADTEYDVELDEEYVSFGHPIKDGYAFLRYETTDGQVVSDENGDCEKWTFLGCEEIIAIWKDVTEVFTLVSCNKVQFGSYPQTLVSDSDLISSLNAAAQSLPTIVEYEVIPNGWNYFTSYYNGVATDSTDLTSDSCICLFYKDITYSGSKYRGLYITKYLSDSTQSSVVGSQQDNGYLTSQVYWFKYEPITWTITNIDSANYCMEIVSDIVLDTMPCAFESDSINYYDSALYAYIQDLISEFIDDEYKSILSDLNIPYNDIFADNCYESFNYSAGASDYAKALGCTITDGKASYWVIPDDPGQDTDEINAIDSTGTVGTVNINSQTVGLRLYATLYYANIDFNHKLVVDEVITEPTTEDEGENKCHCTECGMIVNVTVPPTSE